MLDFFRLFWMGISVKKRMIVILMLLCAVTSITTDELFTNYFSRKCRLDYLKTCVGKKTETIYSIKAADLFDPDYSLGLESDLMKYILEMDGVEGGGRYFQSHISMDNENINCVIAEEGIRSLGNLKVQQENSKLESEYTNYAFINKSLQKKYACGDVLKVEFQGEQRECVVAGYLKNGSSWPAKDQFTGHYDQDTTINLNKSIVIVTKNFADFDNNGGLPHILTYICKQGAEYESIKVDIAQWVNSKNISVFINSQEDFINKAADENELVNSTFLAVCLLYILTIITISASKIVFLYINRKNTAIMIACGVSKEKLIAMGIMESAILVLLPEIIVWLYKQNKYLGTIWVADFESLDIGSYCCTVAHSLLIPGLFLLQFIVIVVVAEMIPVGLIMNMEIRKTIENS